MGTIRVGKTIAVYLAEDEIDVAIKAVREVHTPERVLHEMAQTPANLVRKLTTASQEFERMRMEIARFVESLTDDEIDHIIAIRANKGRTDK